MQSRRKGDLSPYTKFIGAIVMLAFIGITVGLLLPVFQSGGDPSDIAIYLLGNLTAGAMTVLYFLFGSSDGSKKKDEPGIALPIVGEEVKP